MRRKNVRNTGAKAYSDITGLVHPEHENVVTADQISGTKTVKVDACVVGTGAGGAPVAKELAEGGMSVVMLEQGGYHTTDEFTTRHSEMFLKLYRDNGQTVTIGKPPIVMPLGMTVGGTTLINSGTCFRTPDAVLGKWRASFGLEQMTPELLEGFFRRVEREINVCQVPADIAGKNAAVVKRGADKLGLSGDFIFRNVRGCIGSGVCTAGCPTAAKQHVGVTYVPKAWDASAVTYVGAEAKKLIFRNGRVRGVEAIIGKNRLIVEAEHVILSAGTVHSAAFLKQNGVGFRSGQLGRNLSIHPATAVRALFDEEINMAQGVPQSYYIDEYAGQGIMLEGAAVPPGLASAALPYAGVRNRALMERYLNISQFGIMVSDSSRGRIHEFRGRVFIRYDLNKHDTDLFKKALVTLAEVYWAAGARAVYTGLDKLPELRAGEVKELRDLKLKPQDLTLMAFHPLGTCRMGSDPDSAVVDGDLKVHGVEGLYVSDGSVVPSSLGVNPQITIMTLATRLAYTLLGKTMPTDEPAPESMPVIKVKS